MCVSSLGQPSVPEGADWLSCLPDGQSDGYIRLCVALEEIVRPRFSAVRPVARLAERLRLQLGMTQQAAAALGGDFTGHQGRPRAPLPIEEPSSGVKDMIRSVGLSGMASSHSRSGGSALTTKLGHAPPSLHPSVGLIKTAHKAVGEVNTHFWSFTGMSAWC